MINIYNYLKEGKLRSDFSFPIKKSTLIEVLGKPMEIVKNDYRGFL